MTPEEKVAILKKAGVWDVVGFPTCIDKLFDLVAAAEREACAKECDYWAKQAEERGYTCKGETHIDGFGDGAASCAAAIRSRSNAS